METSIKSVTNDFNELVELTMVESHLGDYFYIYVNGKLMHSQYDYNSTCEAIFNECVTKNFDLIYA